MQSQLIKLSKIDPDVIPLVRPLDTNSNEYKMLELSIKKNGQHQAITVRQLTDEERSKSGSKAKFGIIDGHHRYNIALNSGQDLILATIDTTKASAAHDLILALQLNESAQKMSPTEKGSVISQLVELSKTEDNPKGKSVIEVAKEAFNIEKSMAYRCLTAYKKSIGISKKASKKKTDDFTVNSFNEVLKSFPSKQEDFESNDLQQCVSYVNIIETLEKQLKLAKTNLLKREGVKAEVEARRTAVFVERIKTVNKKVKELSDLSKMQNTVDFENFIHEGHPLEIVYTVLKRVFANEKKYDQFGSKDFASMVREVNYVYGVSFEEAINELFTNDDMIVRIQECLDNSD